MPSLSNVLALRLGLFSAAAASLPVNTVAPAITGDAVVNQTLSVTTGTWTGATSYTYQWYWGVTEVESIGPPYTDTNSNYIGIAIIGATASTYLIQSVDVGEVLFCDVTATNATGSTVKSSNYTAAVIGAFVLCGGTPIFLDNTNNPAFWAAIVNATAATGVADPLGGTAAWSITASPVNFCFADHLLNGVSGTTTPVANTTYSVEGYFKRLAGDGFVRVDVINNNYTGGYFLALFDLNGIGEVAYIEYGNTGTLTCNQIEAFTGGYFHISMSGVLSTGSIIAPRLRIWTADSNGDVQSHAAHQIAIYNVGA